MKEVPVSQVASYLVQKLRPVYYKAEPTTYEHMNLNEIIMTIVYSPVTPDPKASIFEHKLAVKLMKFIIADPNGMIEVPLVLVPLLSPISTRLCYG